VTDRDGGKSPASTALMGHELQRRRKKEGKQASKLILLASKTIHNDNLIIQIL